MTKTQVSKNDFTVASAFVWEGKIVSPGARLSLTKAQAIPLEQRGKIEPAKPTAKAKSAAAAKSDDEASGD